MKKKYDLAVKTGTYQKDGQEKGRYQNVGAVMEGEKGMFILLDKTFNPAGIQDGKGSVLIHMFEKQQEQSGGFSDDVIPFLVRSLHTEKGP